MTNVKFFNLNNIWLADEGELRKIAKNDPGFSWEDVTKLDEMSLRIALLEGRNEANAGIISSIAETEIGEEKHLS